MSLIDEATRGTLAAEVLANEVYTGAYALIEAEIINKWRESTDHESRERLHLSLKLLGKLRQVIDATMQNGKVAAKALEAEQTRLERLGSALKRRLVA